MAWFQRIGQPADFDPETPLAFTNFARPSPIVHAANYDIIKPGTWLEHVQAPVAKWIEVWAILKQVRRNFPDEEDTVHRFLLHNWHVGKHDGGSRLNLSPNNVKACALCQRGELHFVQRPGAPETREQTDKLDHALVKCPHSVEFWRHVGTILEKELGTTLSVDDKSPEQAIRGYERVRSKNKRAKDKEGRKLVRTVICLALHQLVKARNRLHGTGDPQPLPPAHRLAHQLTLELRRLDRYTRAT
ncbi:hypothetical protein ACM66B_006405 [Microbotryomycetes sp. NB124-2]